MSPKKESPDSSATSASTTSSNAVSRSSSRADEPHFTYALDLDNRWLVIQLADIGHSVVAKCLTHRTAELIVAALEKDYNEATPF